MPPREYYGSKKTTTTTTPTIGVKIVGKGVCLAWWSISSSFQNSLKTSGHQGYEFLEFGLILAWYRFPATEEFVVVFDVFSFNDGPNVVYMWKIWTAERPNQHRTLIIRSHAVVIAAVCGFALSCWNTRPPEGSICFLSGQRRITLCPRLNTVKLM